MVDPYLEAAGRCCIEKLKEYIPQTLTRDHTGFNEAMNKAAAAEIGKGLRFKKTYLLRILLIVIKLNCIAACNGDHKRGTALSQKYVLKACFEYLPEMARLHLPISFDELKLDLWKLLEEH